MGRNIAYSCILGSSMLGHLCEYSFQIWTCPDSYLVVLEFFFFFLLLNSDGLIIFLEKSQLSHFLFYVQLGNLFVNFKRWAKHSWCPRYCSDPFILSLYLFSSIKYIGKRGKEWTSSLYWVHWFLAKQKVKQNFEHSKVFSSSGMCGLSFPLRTSELCS